MLLHCMTVAGGYVMESFEATGKIRIQLKHLHGSVTSFTHTVLLDEQTLSVNHILSLPVSVSDSNTEVQKSHNAHNR